MMSKNTQLLCTFSNFKDYESSIIKISNHYSICFDKIYVLENTNQKGEFFLTYNIVVNSSDIESLEKTISVHRKKQTNTLYTINALNQIIREKTGKLDSTFQINWNDYKNTIIVTNEVGLRVIPTKIYKIVNLKS